MKDNPFVILLVEDNPDHTELILRGFKDHQITSEIHHVSDGEAALNYLFQRGPYADVQRYPRPDVILLDLRLPRVDGLEVLSQIKTNKELRPIPVVVLTTSEAEGDLGQAYENYVNSYLVKPLDFDQFIQLMGDISLYWLNRNRRP